MRQVLEHLPRTLVFLQPRNQRRDTCKAHRIVQQLSNNSGVGRELSQWFLESFTERKLIVFDLGGQDRHDRRAEGGW